MRRWEGELCFIQYETKNQYHHRGTYIKEWLARFKSVCTNKHYPLTFSLLLFWATKADFQLYVINDGQVRLKAVTCNEGWVSEVHCKRILWFGFMHLTFGNRLYAFILILELMYSRWTNLHFLSSKLYLKVPKCSTNFIFCYSIYCIIPLHGPHIYENLLFPAPTSCLMC